MAKRKVSRGFRKGNTAWKGAAIPGNGGSTGSSASGARPPLPQDDEEAAGEREGVRGAGSGSAGASGAQAPADERQSRVRRAAAAMDFGSPGGRGALRKEQQKKAASASPVLHPPNLHFLVNARMLDKQQFRPDDP